MTTLRKQSASSQSLSMRNLRNRLVLSKATESELEIDSRPSSDEIDCIGTGLDVECVVPDSSEKYEQVRGETRDTTSGLVQLAGAALELGLLISPFFFWGTAMVAMKEVLPKTGPFVVAAFRLIPAGLMLVGFAASRGRSLPSGFNAWLSISAFALIDASCFQVPIYYVCYPLAVIDYVFASLFWLMVCRVFLLKDWRGQLLVWAVYVNSTFLD